MLLMSKLHHVQNAAARIITRSSRRQQVTPLLFTLHWLPVKYRVMFKILLLTYKALNDQAPDYLKELLNQYTPGRCNLRSSGKSLLVIPRSRLVSSGDRSFRVAAPALWNVLPLDIRMAPNVEIFKRLLKTHIFTLAFSDYS